MRTYARIANGVVAELVSTAGDISTMFHPSLSFVETTGMDVAVGWRQAEGGFAPPPPLVDTPRRPTLAELEAGLTVLAGQLAALRAQG
jgi:hypothetical protein